MNKKYLNIFYIFLPLVLGSLMGIIVSNFNDYQTLIKPPFSPPSIVFPIAWSIIYLLLGLSYFFYKNKYEEFNLTCIIYYLSLLINLLWSIIFFALKLRLLAIIWIISLLISLILLEYLFFKQSRISFYLNIFYTLWVIYATYLTIGVYLLNLQI